MLIDSILRASPVMPVIVIDQVEQAVPLAKALLAGGIRVLEVTLRTPAALEGVRRIRAEVPEAIVGTGTVTTGTMAVVEVVGEVPDDDWLRLAGAAEAASEHPIARAIAEHVASDATVTGFENLPGRGVRALVDGRQVLVGTPALVGWTSEPRVRRRMR